MPEGPYRDGSVELAFDWRTRSEADGADRDPRAPGTEEVGRRASRRLTWRFETSPDDPTKVRVGVHSQRSGASQAES